VRALAKLQDIAEAQRGTMLLWAPIYFAVGIGVYFSLTVEPTRLVYAVLGLSTAVAILAAVRNRGVMRGILIVLSLVALGFVDSGLSATLKSAPVLGWRYYGPVQGHIVAIDRSSSDHVRITLDSVHLYRHEAAQTPKRVRITLHYARAYTVPVAGAQVVITANLGPPSGPVEPGGFDFRRYAWFRQLGAIGYARAPLLEIGPPDRRGFAMWLLAVRASFSASIRARIGGQNGAFAAAILTGDRAGIAPEMLTNLRNSNLAHLLAISGLHMGLLTGLVFALVRYGMALVPTVALRVPAKKIAAITSFIAAIAYLMLSGANIATERAFVMIAVALVAIMLDRRALTLRAVALGALIILVARPESLIEAGFQMSFAATTALVAVFEAAQRIPRRDVSPGRLRKFASHMATIVASSAVAGAATGPIAAFHFNRVAEYGLVANLASVPVMGLLVMPSAVMAILATPLGLGAIFWAVMGAGIGWILHVAAFVSGLSGAVIAVAKPATMVLILIAGGGLTVIVLRGYSRAVGLLPVVLGFWAWQHSGRPEILVSGNGALVGIAGPQGRWLSKPKGTGFVAKNWLANDGDAATQIEAAARIESTGGKKFRHSWSGGKIFYSRQKTLDVAGLCAENNLVIIPRANVAAAGCVVLGKDYFARSGAVSVNFHAGKIKLTTARQTVGARLWSH